jgi:hypothetical protein
MAESGLSAQVRVTVACGSRSPVDAPGKTAASDADITSSAGAALPDAPPVADGEYGTSARAGVSNWHYQIMSRQLPATLLQGYLSKQGATLLTLTGKDEQHFTVRLCADAFMDKEEKPPSSSATIKIQSWRR